MLSAVTPGHTWVSVMLPHFIDGLASMLLHPRRSPLGLKWTAPGGAGGSVPWNIVVLLTLLTLLPALLVALTPFTRLLIVFHFLRQALGTQTAPSNQTLIGLALVLTYFLMQPVGSCDLSGGDRALSAWSEWMRSRRSERGTPPLRHFMLKYAREKDLALFLDLAQAPRPARADDVADAGGGAGLHPLGIEDRISDWRGAVSCLFW